jgi:peroxiredoxin family protein
MKLGIVIYSNDAETVWNEFRLGNFAVNKGDEVKAFLLAKGVEVASLDSDRFKVTEDHGGQPAVRASNSASLTDRIYVRSPRCGTSMKLSKKAIGLSVFEPGEQVQETI